MKRIPYFLIIVFSAFPFCALAADPSYSSSTGVVSLPRVTVDNSATYINVELYLNPNGTWQILRADLESASRSLTGSWSGSAISSVYNSCSSSITGQIQQDGTQLTGSVSVNGSCDSSSGSVSGTIDGKQITFGTYAAGGVITFTGTISDDFKTMSGTYTWPSQGDQGTWSVQVN